MPKPTPESAVSFYAGEAEKLRIQLLFANEALIASKAECVGYILHIRRLERRIAIATAVGILAAGAYLYLRFAA